MPRTKRQSAAQKQKLKQKSNREYKAKLAQSDTKTDDDHDEIVDSSTESIQTPAILVRNCTVQIAKQNGEAEQRDQVNDTVSGAKIRKESERRQQAANTIFRRQARQNPEKAERDRVVKNISHRKIREDPQRRQEEQTVDTALRRRARQNPEKAERDRVVKNISHGKIREDPQRRQEEQTVDTALRRRARQNPEKAERDRVVNNLSHQKIRVDPQRRQEKQAVDTALRRQARQNPEKAERDRLVKNISQQKIREDPQRRQKDQAVNNASRSLARQDSIYRTPEKIKDNERKRKMMTDSDHKRDVQMKNTELQRKKRRLFQSSYEDNLDKYKQKICQSPSFICSCCGSLWYKESTSSITIEVLQQKGFNDEDINRILHVPQEKHLLCSTCRRNVNQKRVPRLCLSKGFDFPVIPDALQNLSPLEERLVALRIPFMQIRPLGFDKQSALRGNVVNVENDLDICAQVLPRSFKETSTVQVRFMRRMNYERPYMHEIIRPYKVYMAAKYLMTTELYQLENVVLSENWSGFTEEETMDFIAPEEESDENIEATQQESAITCAENGVAQTAPTNDDDLVAEELAAFDLPENVQNIGAEETLVFNERGIRAIQIAPGEAHTPKHLHFDPKAEEMSFPTIYCGKVRNFDKRDRITYTDIAKSELRRYDRRACAPTKILYSFKRSFNEKVGNAIQICLRQKTNNDMQLTASSARKPEVLEQLLRQDDGYAVFKNLRSSPSYWKEKSKKVLAMVRQIGKCTFFITLSAAETKWKELIIMLMEIVKKKKITEYDVTQLSSDEILQLLRSDPVTCMRHFDHRYRALLSLILKHECGMFAPYALQDYFSRIEFQMRGSPHSHGLYWIKDAPIYDKDNVDSKKACVEFIDKFITCERCEEGVMNTLIGYQIHKHSQTCVKKLKRGKKCRFGFPKPPMKETMILDPLEKDLDEEIKIKANDLFLLLQKRLDSLGREFQENIEYETFLLSLDTNHSDYILAVRSSIKRTTVFLKRDTSSIFVNPYNRKLLEAWGANIDVQFVVDTYACAKYCVSYILKSEGGVSKLLQAASIDARRKDSTVQNKLKQFASILINGSEISAQEAVAFLLGIPNTYCSKQDVFINTGLPDERVKILKPQCDLDKLEDDSDDIFAKGLLHYYTKRPEELENICLAEFASMYDVSKTKRGLSNTATEGNADNERQEADVHCADDVEQDVETVEKSKYFKLMDSNGFAKERRNRKIIRFRHYSKTEDPINYNRERLMLFVPWRDEEKDLLERDPNQNLELTNSIIFENASPFFALRDVDDNALRVIADEIENEMMDVYDDNNKALVDEDLEGLIMEDLGGENLVQDLFAANKRVQQFLPPRMIEEKEYLKIMRTLNEKQRRFVLNALHLLKTSDTPFYHFLSGGAGVGKSHAITALVQSFLRYTAQFPTTNPNEICVLVSAPTGKAAFNVFGMTLHSTFHLPANQASNDKNMCDLNADEASTLKAKLIGTKLFIIDEISMVSVRQFYQIDQRLNQIFHPQQPFGGRSIIVVGHFRQLPPVLAFPVFTIPKQSPMGLCVGNYLWNKIELYEIDEIMRQKGEFEFCKALNNMAEGCMDPEDIALLRSREISADNQPPPDAIRLFESNAACQKYNSVVYESLNTEWTISTAYDKIEGYGSEAQKKKQQEFARTLERDKTDGLPYETRLQVGAEYFVTTNIDVQDRLFNGSTGNLKMIEYGYTAKNVRVPTCVWMDFRNPLIGSASRAKTKSYQLRKNIDLKWVSIRRISRNLSRNRNHGGLQIIRTQIPLVGANAMTITKSQGSSIPTVVVDVSPGPRRKLRREWLYVACSRAMSLAGLFIDGKFEPPNAPRHNDPVSLEMERLRTKPVKFSLKFLQDYDDKYEKIFFHNIQSFVAHHLDIAGDQCAMSSNILAFVEPHVVSTDRLNIPTYHCVHRTDSEHGRNSEGALIFSNTLMLPHSFTTITDITEKRGHCIFVRWNASGVNLIMTYKSPKYSKTKFVSRLDGLLSTIAEKVVVFGDVNINIQDENECILNVFRKYNLKSNLDTAHSTTDGGSNIDICFSNFDDLTAWCYEGYYSYHKAICIVWPKSGLQ